MAHGAGLAAGPDWRQLIADAVAARPQPVMAETFIRKWDTASRPVRLRCADGNNYVVKGQQVGRMAFNDQVSARLGRAIGAPVPDEVALVQVPAELIAANPGEMAHITPGIGHGTKMIENTSERLAIERNNEPYNRPRFALLCIFFGWLGGSDTQYIYSTEDPYLVYSVDHGHFFHGGPNWNVTSLAAGTAVPAVARATMHYNRSRAWDRMRGAARHRARGNCGSHRHTSGRMGRKRRRADCLSRTSLSAPRRHHRGLSCLNRGERQ